MKSYRINVEEMLSDDNIKQSFLKPSRGKRNRKDVKRALENIETEIVKVHDMLINEKFVPTKHIPVTINEGTYLKEREIIKPNYCYEQVVHHIVVRAVRYGIESGMYQYVLGSIPKRGAHSGKKVIEKWIRDDPYNTKYVFKMDIRHFFGSVDHEILKAWLAKKFRDKFILDLLFLIIDAVDMGLPLGYYTSQWLANFLLQPLDHYIKETLHVKYMTRYMDDIVCFGCNKKELHKVHKSIEQYLLYEFKLTIKGNWQIFRLEYKVEEQAITCQTLAELNNLRNDLREKRIGLRSKQYKGKQRIFVKTATIKSKGAAYQEIISKYNVEVETITMCYGRPLDYMGFEFHRGYTIIRESIMLRMTKVTRRVSKQEHINPKDAEATLSYMGWIKHTDTHDFYTERIEPCVNTNTLRKIVSENQKRRNRNECYLESV